MFSVIKDIDWLLFIIFFTNLNSAISGRPHGPYTVKLTAVQFIS